VADGWGRTVKRAVLFDLGNTLVAYYQSQEFPGILSRSLDEVAACLSAAGASIPSMDVVRERAAAENHEAADLRVRPLADRLRRIYGLETTALPPEAEDAACRAFLRPIFALAHVYDDTLPVLRRLRRLGLRLAIVSNTPWGSPAGPWREDLARLGLASAVDGAVFCGDVGWRKPHRRIFDRALERLQVSAGESLFVGDDPRWDTAGARACGIEALLIHRSGREAHGEPRVHDLQAVIDVVTGAATPYG